MQHTQMQQSRMDMAIDQHVQDAAALTAQIQTEIQHVVRALQFEDMVTQLLHYSGKHLDILEGLVEALTNTNTVGDTALLEHLKDSLSQCTIAQDASPDKPVEQETLATGEIELF